MCLLFLLPFVDPRRPLRMVHLDLLVLLGFAASHIYFNKGDISTSTPLAYPPMLYLLGRMLWIGFRPRTRAGPLVPYFPVVVVALGLLFLVGFRVALNITDGRQVGRVVGDIMKSHKGQVEAGDVKRIAEELLKP